LGFYEGERNFLIGKDIHSYINEGLRLVDVFNDSFLWIVIEGEVDFGFSQGRKV